MRPLFAAAVLVGLSGPAFPQIDNLGAHFVQEWDADFDGRVTQAEFSARRSGIFALFDEDTDLVLSDAEWVLLSKYIGIDLPQHDPSEWMYKYAPGAAMHAAMTVGFNDSDGDGQVTQTEFEATSYKLFPMMDIDSDGAVTVADFAR